MARGSGGNSGGIGIGGILVIVGIVVLILWSFWIGLIIALIGKAVSTPAHPLHLDAGFSPGGWLAVIMTFVLARVFAEGTLMRADLEGTV